MREELFKMERKGLVEEGQQVKVTERVNGSLYSYLVEPSVAMCVTLPPIVTVAKVLFS